VLTERRLRWAGLVELDYRVAIGPTYGSATLHNGGVAVRVDHGLLTLRLACAYGHGSGDYAAWGYRMDRADLRLEAGPGFDLGSTRLAVGAGANLFSRDVRYRDGTRRPRGGFGLGAGVSWLFPILSSPLAIHGVVRAGLDVEHAPPVAPVDDPARWQVVPYVGVGIAVEIF
jgi:hypothetical protein